METKICKHCELELPTGNFYKNKASKDGLTRLCKTCSHKANKDWAKDNPDKAKEHISKWKQNNPTYDSDYYESNRDKKVAYVKQWKQNKIQTDPYFAYCNRLDVYFVNHIRSIKNSNNFFGCDIITLIKHLESQFTPEMNWDNHGKYWEIDHILPRSSFNLYNEDERKKCYHYTNLQPLTKKENRTKSNKML
jgi:hypothetical protein